MTTDGFDPLDELRRAWSRLDPPANGHLSENGDSLDACDSATKASVRWLKAAWTRLPVPAAQPPSRFSLVLRGRWRFVPVLRRLEPIQLAAAALLLVSAAAAYHWAQPASPPRRETIHEAAQAPSSPAVGSELRATIFPFSPQLAGFSAGQGGPMSATPVPMPGPIRVAVFFSGQLPPLGGWSRSSAGDDLLAQVAHLNEKGAWAAAADMGQVVLAREAISRAQRCEALCQLAHSLRCLGRPDESEACLALLEEEMRP
ncbi:MAG: hypothetical protein HY812_18480 [Planctomycetes bacterium]|nr:hypothetical protein [Planctomycetota bacterium]